MPGTNLTREEAAARARLIDVTSTDVALELDSTSQTFRSTSRVRFTCHQPGSSTFVDLIAPTVLEVELNGRSLPVGDVVSSGRIALSDLQEHNDLRVVADAAYMQTGEGLHRFVDPVDDEVYLYSQFEVSDARRVFACFDQPDLKSSFTFTVTAPERWQVVSVSPTPVPQPAGEGRATWRFAPTPRLSCYVTAIIAGPYHVERTEGTSRDGRTIPLGVFCRASLAEFLDTDDIIEVTRAGLAYYEDLFDQPYPFAKYDQLFVPEFNAGAMENAGAVTITELYVFRSKVPQAVVERRGLTLLHEMAHMWFGDLVTMRWWDDLWLNESFAEYASTRCQTAVTRWRDAWTTFSSAEKSWAYRQDQFGSTHPIVADIRDLADVEVNFDGITYAKGASVLKQLVHWVGEPAFDEGVRNYFARYAWGNTTLAELLAELEATSGRDLDTWAADWLRTAGVATLRPEIQTDERGVITSCAIIQEPPAEHPVLRSHRLAVGCYDLVGDRLCRTHRVELDVAGARTDVGDLVGRPRPRLLLVNDDDLAYAKIRLDGLSLPTVMNYLGAFEDCLPRTLVWGAVWDMTRDAEIGAREFVDLVLEHVTSVDNPSVSQTLLRQLSATLHFYVAPEFRRDTTAAAGDRLLGLLHEAEPGSDMQLLLARSFTAHATTEDHLDLVEGLLAGTREIDGLVVDTERRWDLLSCLIVNGQATEDSIEQELTRDDTATGRVHAASARAALPNPEAKATAWKQVVEESGLPNAIQAAVIGGFCRVDDPALLEPFVGPYFDNLTRIWAERTSEMASQIVTGLYPAVVGTQDVLDRTEHWLRAHPEEPSLRRLLIEGRDGVVRALKAQERDRRGA